MDALLSSVSSKFDAAVDKFSVPLTRRLNNDYEALASYYDKMLSTVGISFEGLSDEAKADVNLLVGVADVLGLQSASISILASAISDMDQRHFDLKRQISTMDTDLNCLADLHRDQLTVQQELKRLLAERRAKTENEATECTASTQQLSFLEAKCEKYLQELESCTQTLSESGYYDGVSHEALINKRKEIDTLRGTVSGLSTEVELYCGLPPDLMLAEQELEKLKGKLKDVEATLNNRLQGRDA